MSAGVRKCAIIREGLMSIELECDSCGQEIRALEEFAGRKVRCPTCRTVMTVPAAEKEHARPLPRPVLKRTPSRAKTKKRRAIPVLEWAAMYWYWIVAGCVVAIDFLSSRPASSR
jgi:hypothetical protein